jgi:hypothetical protein
MLLYSGEDSENGKVLLLVVTFSSGVEATEILRSQIFL